MILSRQRKRWKRSNGEKKSCASENLIFLLFSHLRRKNFCFNLDPSHFIPQFLDPAEFAREFADRIRHVHIKDAKRRLNGRRSILGSHLPFGSHERGWDFVSPGHGDVDFSSLIRALNDIHYEGPLSVEWEDNGMDRTWGIRSAIEFVRTMNFAPSKSSFEDLMKKN